MPLILVIEHSCLLCSFCHKWAESKKSIIKCPIQFLLRFSEYFCQGSKFIFRFGSPCATKCKFLGAELKILGAQLQRLGAPTPKEYLTLQKEQEWEQESNTLQNDALNDRPLHWEHFALIQILQSSLFCSSYFTSCDKSFLTIFYCLRYNSISDLLSICMRWYMM